MDVDGDGLITFRDLNDPVNQGADKITDLNGNGFIDGMAAPKAIDFGVAKATQVRLSGRMVYTQLQKMVGAPLYMSPEQAAQTSLDRHARSDIYSLGVLLSELLTGQTPIGRETIEALHLQNTAVFDRFSLRGMKLRPAAIPAHASTYVPPGWTPAADSAPDSAANHGSTADR